jgi:glycosyltransferase involved in cell wall biosynthesis
MSSFFEFKWKFFIYRIVGLFTSPRKTNKFIFIVEHGAEDWILGAKARRLSKYFEGESEVIFSKNFKHLPDAPGYFFLHQKYYTKALRFNPFLAGKQCMVMFTHENWTKAYSKKHILYALKHAYKVVCLNRQMADALVSDGLTTTQLEVFHLAANPEFFPPKPTRQGRTVGFCCFYTDRKNPDLITHLVNKMPDLNFVLVGRNWEKYPRYTELMDASNFKYYADIPYEEYPACYQEMDVFVSPSFVEGGPVPLLEAMLTNLVPVASNTGFCPDLINHGENGFLFDPMNDSNETVEEFVRKALELSGDIRQYALPHTWENYGAKIYNLHLAGQ